MSTQPLTLTWYEAATMDAAEALLVNGWRAALATQTPTVVAALIVNAVAYEPRLGLPMENCDRPGCSVLVDETARDEHGLYCSDTCRDDEAHHREQTRQRWAA